MTIVSYDLSSPVGDLGTTHTFIAGGVPVIVTGYGGDLYIKHDGGEDIGLGLTGHSDHEIYHPGNLVQFDISHLGNSAITILPNSSIGDVWQFWASDTPGVTQTLLASGTGNNAVTVTDNSQFLDATSTSCCGVLVGSFQADIPSPSNVSEPSSLTILAVGLAISASLIWKWKTRNTKR